MTSLPSLIFLKTKKAEIMSIFIYQPDTHFREDPFFSC
jgi:hypothetical protein